MALHATPGSAPKAVFRAALPRAPRSRSPMAWPTARSERIRAAPAGFPQHSQALVGYKPTARRMPQGGAIPLSKSLDSIGPIARSVACCATLDAILANETSPDLTDRSLVGLRFAVARTFVLEDLDSDVAAHFARSLSRLSAAGARVEEIQIPELANIPTINNAKGGFSAAESYAWHHSLIESRASAYDPRVLSRIQRGATQSAADYIALLAARSAFIAAVEQRIARFDALIMPTTPMIPPRIAALQSDDEFFKVNALALRNPAVINLLDGCAISVPNHEEGEPPTGLTLACRGGLDQQLFRCAAAAEDIVRASSKTRD